MQELEIERSPCLEDGHGFLLHDPVAGLTATIDTPDPEAIAAFVGDTSFAMGCGRLFEGTPARMTASLEKIRRWPDSTRLYCAHE